MHKLKFYSHNKVPAQFSKEAATDMVVKNAFALSATTGFLKLPALAAHNGLRRKDTNPYIHCI